MEALPIVFKVFQGRKRSTGRFNSIEAAVYKNQDLERNSLVMYSSRSRLSLEMCMYFAQGLTCAATETPKVTET